MKTSLAACSALLFLGVQAFSQVGTEIDRTAAPTQQTDDSRGIIIVGGAVYTIESGRATPLREAMTLQVDPSGTLTGFDGRPQQIPAGQMLTMDGRFTQIPTGIQGLPSGTYVPPADAGASATGTPGMEATRNGQPQGQTGATGQEADANPEARQGLPDTNAAGETNNMNGTTRRDATQGATEGTPGTGGADVSSPGPGSGSGQSSGGGTGTGSGGGSGSGAGTSGTGGSTSGTSGN